MLKKENDTTWKIVYEITEVVKFKHLTIDEYLMDWLNGKYYNIFPEFDKNKHTVSLLGHPEASKVNQYLIAMLHVPREDTDPLPSGLFVFKCPDYHSHYLEKIEIRDETFLETEQTNRLITDVESFFKSSDKYKQAKLHHKRGALLFGPQGSGKSVATNRLLLKMKDKDIVGVIVPSNVYDLDVLKKVQEAVGERPFVIIFEELTERLKEDRSSILSFLDGQFSTKNTYFIATTNYPEDLPANLIDRPGRFDLLLEYGNPTQEQIHDFVLQTTSYDLNDEELVLLKSFSWAYIREVVAQYHITSKSIKDIHHQMKSTRQKYSETFKGGFGLK